MEPAPWNVYMLAELFTATLAGWTGDPRLTVKLPVAVSSTRAVSVLVTLVAVTPVTSCQLLVPPTPGAVPTSQVPLAAPVHFTESVPVTFTLIWVLVVSYASAPAVRPGRNRVNPDEIAVPA